ncbi:hypothetical protein [Streptomyces sp. NPDC058612]|uniref:hypothetical protein n=1 Tax=Streptomyces sp. NPDC058612 TaxID=3346555 RepID=UPI00364B01DE
MTCRTGAARNITTGTIVRLARMEPEWKIVEQAAGRAGNVARESRLTIKERAVPTNFPSEDQRRRFGRFAEDPDEGQPAGPFLLDQTARRRTMAAKVMWTRRAPGWPGRWGRFCSVHA